MTMAVAVRGERSPVAMGTAAAALDDKPALRAWVAAHEREGRRMAIPTDALYAQWVGVDPGAWSKWKRGLVPVPPKQGRRLVALFDHDPKWEGLWQRLLAEQDRRELRRAREARPPEN
jgi:hypothetical protein